VSDDEQQEARPNMQHRPGFSLSYLFPPLLGLAGYLSMILISELISHGQLPTFSMTAYGQLNFLLTMQAFILPVSFLVLLAIYLYDREAFRMFFRIGDLFAKAQPLRLLGIGKDSTWKKAGPLLTIIVTSVTVIVTVIGVRGMDGVISGKLIALFPLALIMAATNAWSEEIFTRFTIVAGLQGRVRAAHKYWISALIFGLPHYYGTPGGLLGIVLTGILGWLLAKSVEETKGMFWAWFIHFIQDVVIFTAQLMFIVGAM
jgi:membrane protease YdiL (CAAX protease family)